MSIKIKYEPKKWRNGTGQIQKGGNLTNLPFEGFYESTLSEHLHDECEEFGGIINRQTFISIAIDYAKAYLTKLGQEYPELDMPYEQIQCIAQNSLLISPREYNFNTDRIQVELPTAWVQQAFTLCDKMELAELFERDFANRSGFYSFYNANLADYPNDLSLWQNPHGIGLVLECLHCPVSALELLESEICNGAMAKWLNP